LRKIAGSQDRDFLWGVTESKIRTTTIDTLIIILTDSEIIGMKRILLNETTLADRESQITEN